VWRLQITAYAGIPLTTGEGQVLGSFCVADHQPRQWTPEEIQLLQDLSASAITEIECRLQADEVERYRRILQRFRAPLAELRDHLDTLSRAIARRQDEQIRHFVQPAITRVEQLKKIEGELADIAPRPDRDPQSAASTTDLRRCVAIAVEMAQELAQDHPIRLHIQGTPLRISGDATALQKALLSLLTTATNYATATNSIDVRLQKEEGEAELEVQARGRAIPAADLTRMLARFHRAPCESPELRRRGGVGLKTGSGVVEARAPGIVARSVEGEGTTFLIRLPLVKESTQSGAAGTE
jgi:two-component system sensor histidine kinase SenX3